MATNDLNRTRRTYSYYRGIPRPPQTTIISGGNGIEVTGDNNQVIVSIDDTVVPSLSGNNIFTESNIFPGGLTGSLQEVSEGTSYMIAGADIVLSTNSLGQVTIGSLTTGTGDPDASYIVLGVTGSLSNERVLTEGTGINIVDAGANSTITVDVDDNVVATITGSTFTGQVITEAGLVVTGSLEMGDDSILVPPGKGLYVDGPTGTINMVAADPSSNLYIGQTSAAGPYANMFVAVPTGRTIYIQPGFTAATFTATGLHFQGGAETLQCDNTLTLSGTGVVAISGSSLHLDSIPISSASHIEIAPTGTSVASSGSIRLASETAMVFRKQSDLGNLVAISTNINDDLIIGDTDAVQWPSQTRVEVPVNVRLIMSDTATCAVASGTMLFSSSLGVIESDSSSLYASGSDGAGVWVAGNGTETVFGPGDPICPRCGIDYVLSARNRRLGWEKTMCLNCLVGSLDKAGISRGEYMIVDKDGDI